MTAKRLFTCISVISIIAATYATSSQQASAWWVFHKKQPGEGGFFSHFKRKHRDISATQVGLVPGNPPALYWKPEAQPRAAVLCLHELGLYNGVFDDLGQRMSKQGIAVYAIDLRGFGGWQQVKGPEGRMSLDKTLSDVKGSVEVMHKLHPGIPVFILGEAMGGALALQAAATFPDLIQGAISSCPGGEHFKTMQHYAAVAGKLVAAGPHGDSGMSEELMSMATPKKELQEAYASDELVRMDLKPTELMDCQFFMYKAKQFARNIKNTPVLVVHGDKDGESRPEGSTHIYDKLATKDKKMLTVPDGDHYIFEDTKVSDKAMDTTLAWIDEHLSKRSD
jgi:alpha-beta hydrolase superfamily lysophospholipase